MPCLKNLNFYHTAPLTEISYTLHCNYNLDCVFVQVQYIVIPQQHVVERRKSEDLAVKPKIYQKMA